MNNEEEKKCPLCAEEMDWTDQQLNPCKCGYEVCVWCWHHIMDMAEKDATEGRCPACRIPYDKDRIVGLEANFQRVAGNNSSRKQKLPKAKPKANESRKDLSNVRVIQRKMAYIIGLPLDLADEDTLQQKENFGQYGKVTKVSLSRTAGGTLQQFTNDTCSVYITYSKEEEAVTCIQAVHGYVLDGRLLRASFGTAKYCHAWLRNTPCNNPSCLYLHTLGADEDSFGKDEVAAVHTRNRVQEIVGATQYPHRRSGIMLPPPVVEQLNNQNASEDPVYNDGSKDVAYTTVATNDHLPVKTSTQMTSFVDIVGRSSNSSSIKDVNSVEDERILTVETEISDPYLSKSSTPNEFVNSPTFDEQRLKDSVGSFIPYPADTRKNYSDNSWWHSEYQNEEDNMISVLSDGFNEMKFENSAKSDMIYRGSNSFSNEEIVEHLRRLDNDAHVGDNDEDSAAVESSIISNILSMDLDGDNSDYNQTVVTGLLETNGRSSRNYQNYDQSRFSFAKEHVDLLSPSNVGQGLTFSVPKDSYDNRDCFFKPQNQVASRAQSVTPPGFSVPSKPPPGFSACMRTDQAISAGSGNYFRIPPNNHYRSPSLGNISNSSDDVIGNATTVGVGGTKSSTPNGLLTSSWTSSRCSNNSYDDDSKPWHFMQQQSGHITPLPHHHHHQESQYPQNTIQYPSSHDVLYGGLTSGVVDVQNQQSYNQPSLFTQQPKFAGGVFQQQNNQLLETSQQQQHGIGIGNRSEVERFSLLPGGYGDYMFQMPTSGDVYNRVFGM